MMFIDASAIISIIAGEDDGPSLAARLGQADHPVMSPVVVYEAVAGLARQRACPVAEAQKLIDAFVAEIGAEIMPIDGAVGRRAVEAFDHYGKGRHRADLNMGDCFAYACAMSRNLPLLFKGNDFVHTDIEVA